MWDAAGTAISMAEGDFGIKLPVEVEGATISAADSLRFTIKDRVDGELILEKDYTNVQENTVELELTEAETALLPVGKYAYRLDWYQNGNFMCNVIPNSVLRVVNKV